MKKQALFFLLEKSHSMRIIMKGEYMEKPNGADLLLTLVKLYSDQEGVKITCEIHKAKINT